MGNRKKRVSISQRVNTPRLPSPEGGGLWATVTLIEGTSRSGWMLQLRANISTLGRQWGISESVRAVGRKQRAAGMSSDGGGASWKNYSCRRLNRKYLLERCWKREWWHSAKFLWKKKNYKKRKNQKGRKEGLQNQNRRGRKGGQRKFAKCEKKERKKERKGKRKQRKCMFWSVRGFYCLGMPKRRGFQCFERRAIYSTSRNERMDVSFAGSRRREQKPKRWAGERGRRGNDGRVPISYISYECFVRKNEGQQRRLSLQEIDNQDSFPGWRVVYITCGISTAIHMPPRTLSPRIQVWSYLLLTQRTFQEASPVCRGDGSLVIGS